MMLVFCRRFIYLVVLRVVKIFLRMLCRVVCFMICVLLVTKCGLVVSFGILSMLYSVG